MKVDNIVTSLSQGIKQEPKFYLEGHQGMWVNLPNGYTVSAQWGRNNYCENCYNCPLFGTAPASPDAEIAYWVTQDPERALLPIGNDDVLGWQSVAEVQAFIAEVGKKPPVIVPAPVD